MERKVEASGDKMNSRIDSILKIMDLQDRMIDVETCSSLHGEIDYENVEKCLAPYIAYSKDYLNKAMLG